MCVLIRERGHLVEAHAVVARRRRRHRVLGHGDGLARVPQTFDQGLHDRLRPDDLGRKQFLGYFDAELLLHIWSF